MTRIELKDTLQDVVVKLVDGNPGAITVCMRLIQDTALVDPDAAMPEVINLLALDTLGIYGPRIWMLYKDVCKESIVSVITVLRAVQLGILSKMALDYAIDNYGEGMDLEELSAEVRVRLPKLAASE